MLKTLSWIMRIFTGVFHKNKSHKKILIFRCGGLGDFLLETVTIHRLCEFFHLDGHEIFYVHRAFNAETIPMIIPVNRVIIFREESFLHIILSAINLWKHKYDILINMSDPRYSLMHRVVGLCQAEKRICYDYPKQRFTDNEFDAFRKEYNCFVKFSWEHDHVMNMNLNLLTVLTGKTFPLPEYADYIKIHENISPKKTLVSKPYIVFSLFGSTNERNLPDEKIITLFSYCKNKFPSYKIVIAGASKDDKHAQVLINSSRECINHLVNLCGQTCYFDLYKLAKNADFMIGIDSGITHFGALFSPHTFVLARKHLPELFWPYPKKFMKNITIVTDKQYQCNSQCLKCLQKETTIPCMKNLQTEHIISAIERFTG